MEGIAGIAHLRQVMRGTDDYPRSRELMTEEANAAVAGAFDGGATRAVVTGSHRVPVGRVAGDDKCGERAAKRLPGLRTVAVKQARGRHVATSISPERARREIRKASADAVRGAPSVEPFRPHPPFVLEADTA